MDIFKMAIKKLYEPSSLMLGNFYVDAEPCFNAGHIFDFSCDVASFYEKINGVLPVRWGIGRHAEILKHISNFIESCLILGEFLHEVRSIKICLIKSYCFTEFFIAEKKQLLEQGGRLKEPRSIRISMESHEDEKVLLKINSTRSNNYPTTDIIFECPRMYSVYGIPGFDVRRIPGSTACRIMNKHFNKPQYKRLPLYINTPFIRDYAKDQYMNPPPPPEEYFRPISKIFYI